MSFLKTLIHTLIHALRHEQRAKIREDQIGGYNILKANIYGFKQKIKYFEAADRYHKLPKYTI